MVEQRYLAVREAMDGAMLKDVDTRYGVDRRTAADDQEPIQVSWHSLFGRQTGG